MEYDCLNADRLGDDAWIGAVFFCFREKYLRWTREQACVTLFIEGTPRPAVSKMSEANDHIY